MSTDEQRLIAAEARVAELEAQNAFLAEGVNKLHSHFHAVGGAVETDYWGRDVYDCAVERMTRVKALEEALRELARELGLPMSWEVNGLNADDYERGVRFGERGVALRITAILDAPAKETP
jgi:hypothetical protein